MSLQLWLPLNGNINNYGLNGVLPIATGITVDNNGKIGKCYHFSGSDYISLDKIIIPSQSQEWSFSCWFCLDNNTSNTAMCLFSERTNTNATGYTIFLYANTGQMLIDDGVRWTITPMNFNASTWYHLVIIRDPSGKKIYVNGELKSSTTTIGNTSTINTNGCLIGRAQNSSTLTSGNQGFVGKLNDVRIYNHSLSLKEIKNLAKGLILHYKLNGDFNDTNKEFDCSGYQYDGNIINTITIEDSKARYNNSNLFNKNTSININMNPSFIKEGSCSFWAKINENGNTGWIVLTGDNSSYYLIASTTSKDFYNSNVNGTIKYYIDGEESRRPSFDNNWHYYCITGFDLSNWTIMKLNNYSNNYNCNINYSDFRLYNTILSLEDIQSLYNNAGYIDRNNNFYAYEYIEKQISSPQISKRGVFSIPYEIKEDDNYQANISQTSLLTNHEFYEL